MAPFLSDKSRSFQQLRHFAFVDSPASSHPFPQPIPHPLIIIIIHFMPSSMLGLRGILYRFTSLPIYLVFGLPWNLAIQKSLILHSQPSSIFFTPRSIRIISSVFFPLSRLPYPVSFFPFTACLHSVLCSTYTCVFAAFFLHNCCTPTIPHIYHIYLLDGFPSYTNDRRIKLARVPGHVSYKTKRER